MKSKRVPRCAQDPRNDRFPGNSAPGRRQGAGRRRVARDSESGPDARRARREDRSVPGGYVRIRDGERNNADGPRSSTLVDTRSPDIA